jgi:hypothetical protein
MLVSSRQAIVLGVSLAALICGVGGLVVVSRMPPAPPPQKSLDLQAAWKARNERRLGKRAVLPDPTDAPPLAGEASASKTIAKAESKGKEEPQKKVSADKSKGPTTQDDETLAAEKLKQAKEYVAQNNVAKAKECCQEIIDKYGSTKALQEAVVLFNTLK